MSKLRRKEPAWSTPRPLVLFGYGQDSIGLWRDYENGTYIVRARTLTSVPGFVGYLQIAREDGMSRRDWRDEQWIKDQLLGEEACCVEFYPPAAVVRDPSNASFLWQLKDASSLLPWTSPGYRLHPNETPAPQRGWAMKLEAEA